MTPTTLALQMPYQSKGESVSSIQQAVAIRRSAAERKSRLVTPG